MLIHHWLAVREYTDVFCSGDAFQAAFYVEPYRGTVCVYVIFKNSPVSAAKAVVQLLRNPQATLGSV